MTHQSRRNFLATAAALTGTTLITPAPASAEQGQATWDLGWLDSLRGKHRATDGRGMIDQAHRGGVLPFPADGETA